MNQYLTLFCLCFVGFLISYKPMKKVVNSIPLKELSPFEMFRLGIFVGAYSISLYITGLNVNLSQ